MSSTPARIAPTRVWRRWDWARPVRATRREQLYVATSVEQPGVPVLFVPDVRDAGAAALQPWLLEAADRGHPAYAVSPRATGGTARPGPRFAVALREWVHDVVQAACGLPTRCVLVGHGTGALVVAHALHRYPAAAGVLIEPRGLPGHRFPGAGTLVTRPRLAARMLTGRDPRRAPTSPPLLVAGGAGYPAKVLDALAVRYGAESARLPGTGNVPGLAPVVDWLAGQAE